MVIRNIESTRRNTLTLANTSPIQMGFWLPARVWVTAKFLSSLRIHIAAKKEAGLLAPTRPVIGDFKAWVETQSIYRMWVTRMIQQANEFVNGLDPETKADIADKDGDILYIENFDNLFEILNEIVCTSPAFNDTAMVGTPMHGLLAISMGTKAGVALFHDAAFNAQFKKVLDAWNDFLKSPASLDKLNIDHPEKEGSWISRAAWDAGVWDQMVFDSTKPGYGFDSWNSFFIRKFAAGARPFHGDPRHEINIGCETTPWQYADNLSFKSDFWIKDVNYSLLDLFGGREQWARLFEGGQLYQGFLSATRYHRWNSPLDGRLLRSWVQPGTYFAQRPGQGQTIGTWEGTESQPYLGHVATRAVFVFEHPVCGYVALICIGMVEVSGCVIAEGFKVREDQTPINITRDTEIGHFEFGGSTHVMIFQRDKVHLADWAVNAPLHQHDPQPVPMGTVIATSSRR